METKKLGSKGNDKTTKIVGRARKEKNAQVRLISMQTAIAKGEVPLSVLEEKTKKLVEKLRAAKAKLGDSDVSDFTELKRLAEQEFPNVTRESLSKEQAIKAGDFCDRLIAPTPAQRAVVTAYHAMKASQDWFVISEARAFIKAFCKPLAAAVNAPAPAEVEAV